MKVNTGSYITVLECLPYYQTWTNEGKHGKWNLCPWMPPLLLDRSSWRSTLDVKSPSLNASPAIWQWLSMVKTGSKITVLECFPYCMTVAHEGQHWKSNHCPWLLPLLLESHSWRQHWMWNHWPWMPPLLYDRGSWRSTLEVKSLYWMPPRPYDRDSWR